MLKKLKWKQYIAPTLHILVWASLFLFIWYNANTIGPFRKQDGSIYPPLLWSTAASIALFYGNALYLIPRFISKQRYKEYFLWAILLYTAIVALNSTLDDSYVLSLTSSEKEPLLATIILNIQSKLVIFSLSLGYGLARQWNINEKIKQKLIREKLAAELKYLKAQINPHFLFNTLNMAYASAIKSNDSGTADIIEKLSVLMRYALYESNEDKVALEKEMSYIDNYIKLQLQRLSPELTSRINYSAKGDWRNRTIAPMILIPYIENVFKHGIILTKKSDVVINITLASDSLLLETKNGVNKIPNKKENNNSGIGMHNAKERLKLLYPDKHHLKFETVDGIFYVSLKIQL